MKDKLTGTRKLQYQTRVQHRSFQVHDGTLVLVYNSFSRGAERLYGTYNTVSDIACVWSAAYDHHINIHNIENVIFTE